MAATLIAPISALALLMALAWAYRRAAEPQLAWARIRRRRGRS